MHLTVLDVKVPVITVFLECIECAPPTKKRDQEIIEEQKSIFISFIPNLCAILDIEDNEKKDMPTLYEFIRMQFTDLD